MSSLPPVAILAGGLATRLRPITTTIPKAMVEVAGEPFVAHQLRHLKAQGMNKVVFCLGFLGEQVEEYLKAQDFGLDLGFSYDWPKLLGTGGALRKALPLLDEEFFVLYGDSYLNIDYAPVYQAFKASGRDALMTVFNNQGQWDSSNVEFANGQIIRYSKTDKSPEMLYIDYGLGLWKAQALKEWPEDTQFDLALAYGQLVADKRLAGFEVTTRFYEIGSHQGLAELNQLLQAGRKIP